MGGPTADGEPEWWQSFFAGLWLDVHPLAKKPEATREEADFLATVFPKSARVLDVPCGDGRIARELVARGFSVTGVDVTPALLDRGPEGYEHVLSDMRDLSWDSAFDGACNMWGSFGYFSDAENERFVRAVARALRPGGVFVTDTWVLEGLLPNFTETSATRLGDVLLVEERALDVRAGRVECDWTFVKGDAVDRRHSSIRLYSLNELETLLRRNGFEGFEEYASPKKDPFKAGTRLYLVARRIP
jgi:SAM-dependent methyltransferase